MVHLIYYKKEREEFSKEFGKYLIVDKANIIIKKLIRHYKLSKYNSWKFTKGSSSKCLTYHINTKNVYGKFTFSKTRTSIGVICHELAHAIETLKRGKSTHASKHYKIMKRMINYCNKMGYIK